MDERAEREDRELILRMASRDANALDAFYTRYNRVAFSLILRIVGNRQDAEDVLTDAFWQVWQQSGRYDSSRGKPIAWLLTIAHHTAIDEVRKHVPETSDLDPQMADHRQPTPHQSAERAELAAVLRTAIDRLRPEYRELVALKYEQELEYDEIVEITGMPVGTVKSSLHRARKELVDHLDEMIKEVKKTTPSLESKIKAALGG